MKKQITFMAAVLLLLFAASIGFGQCKDAQSVKSQFHQFDSAKQAKIWRNHLRFALQTEKLNSEQRQIVSDFLAVIKDDSYTAESDKAAFTELGLRAKVAFPDKAQLARIFYALTSEEQQGFTLEPAAYYKRIESSDCTCSSSDNILCDVCHWELLSCKRTDWGCGFGWLLPCDAVCRSNDLEIQ
jgi:hypothetical protein